MFKKYQTWKKRRNDSKLLGLKQAYEDFFKTNTDRYVDRLIQEEIHNIQKPVHRERVAFEDPLARLFFWDFQMKGWDEYPKFYESDQLDAPEILPEIRDFLMDIDFHKPAIVQGVLKQIHGWVTMITEIKTDPIQMKPVLDYTIFSERQCNSQNIIRAGKTVLGWRVQLMPQLPLNRTPVQGDFTLKTVPREAPNIIFDTRGEEQASWGYGYSRFESIWDPLTKLRMESDSDNFRKSIFPIAVYPPDWDDAAVNKFFDKMSNLSRTTAVAYPAAKDQEGKLYDTIPSLTFMSPSDDVKQTGSGQFGGLSSEWTRLLSSVKHSMGYIVGGGAISASQSAAGVDLDDDQKSDIAEWNLINKSFIRKFLQYLVVKGIIPELPEGFTIKCAWQWKYDEMMAQQVMMAEHDLLMQDQQQDNENEQAKQNRKNVIDITDSQLLEELKENGFFDILKGLLMKRQPSLGAQKRKVSEKIKSEKTFRDVQLAEVETYPELAGWKPVNSASGNVKQAALDMGDDDTAPTIYLEFEGNKVYSYQDPDMIKDTEGVFQDILEQGGEAVWEHLRASKGMRSSYEKGAAPKGSAKTGGGKYAYAGRAHMTDYQKERGDPIVKQKQSEIREKSKAVIQPLQAEKKQLTQQIKDRKKGSKIGKVIGTGIKKTFGAVGKIMGKVNQEERRHPILQRANSISDAVKNGFIWEGKEYHSKSKAYEILNMVSVEARFNEMKMGNSFSTKNPFRYPDQNSPLGYVVEYQCPESIKKLVNTSWPIWIDHQGEREEKDYVGTYTINGYDENLGIEIASYDINWEKVDQWFEANNQSNFTLDAQGNRITPDTSTEYKTNIKYDKDRHVFIQTDFQMAGVALVPFGNCSSPYCSLK